MTEVLIDRLKISAVRKRKTIEDHSRDREFSLKIVRVNVKHCKNLQFPSIYFENLQSQRRRCRKSWIINCSLNLQSWNASTSWRGNFFKRRGTRRGGVSRRLFLNIKGFSKWNVARSNNTRPSGRRKTRRPGRVKGLKVSGARANARGLFLNVFWIAFAQASTPTKVGYWPASTSKFLFAPLKFPSTIELRSFLVGSPFSPTVRIKPRAS